MTTNDLPDGARLMTRAEVDAVFRAGYGAGGDAVQKERRNRPFLLEDEALDQWKQQQSR